MNLIPSIAPARPIACSDPAGFRARGVVRLLALVGFLALAAVIFPRGLAAGERPAYDKVRLKDGSTAHGLVVETGGNRISLEMTGGSRTILKRDIERIEFNRTRAASEKMATDRVELGSGHTVSGKVTLIEGGTKVQVELAGRKTTVVYPRDQIRRILWKDELVGSTTLHYSQELERRVEEALKGLDDEDPAARKKDEEFLIHAGILAIDKVKEAYAALAAAGEAVSAGEPGEPAASPRLDALRRIVHVHELKTIIPPEIEETHPQVYEVLGHGSTHEKDSLLKLILPNLPDQSVDLALYLIKYPYEDDKIRSVLIDMLRRMQKNWALLKLYNESQGQLQLVSAIALGKNHILLGVPTIIEALSLSSEDLRRLAGDTLFQLTGKDFGFRADGAPMARQTAVREWQSWWTKNQDQIEKSARAVLQGGDADSPQRATARDAWRLGHEAWRLKQLDQAEAFFQKAIQSDPTFVKASISLAALYYTDLERLSSAERLLRDLAERPIANMTSIDHYWICLELGNVYRMLGKYAEAKASYKESLQFNADSVYGVLGVAECNWLLGTGKGDSGAVERQAHLREALAGYEEAFKLFETAVERLVALRPEDVVDLENLPFDRRLHNRTVWEVRSGYEEEMARLFIKIGKAHLLLDSKESAVRELGRGVRFVEAFGDELTAKKKLLVDMRSLLAHAYESLGQNVEAIQQLRVVLSDLDPENEHCKQALARLRRRILREKE
ncbi:MAG: hypothetical protein JXA90_08380 [Planctomycetes bacterium]|nr:hypothetical protein [Planctomycetota bacterium]